MVVSVVVKGFIWEIALLPLVAASDVRTRGKPSI